MKKIVMLILLVSILSCTSTYKVRIETPSQWYERNTKEKKDEKDLPNVKEKLENLKTKENNLVKSNSTDSKNIVNLKETEVYEKNNFFTKPSTNNLDTYSEIYTEDENKLIEYITKKVLENETQVKEMIKTGYSKINHSKINRQAYIAYLAKLIRDKNLNNFSYVVDRVNEELGANK